MYPGFDHSHEEKLAKGLRWSLIGHGVVFSLAFFKSLIFPSEVKPFVPVLRVDMVGLPDLTKEEMKELKDAAKAAADAEAAKVKEAEKQQEDAAAQKAAEEEMLLQKEKEKKEADQKQKEKEKREKEKAEAKKKEETEKKRLEERKKKRDEALDRIKREKEREAALERIKAMKQKEAAAVIKGNQISPGTSLEGKESTDAADIYQSVLRDRIRSKWELPIWIQRQDLRSLVRIFIDAHGRVVRVVKIQQSGNPQFDSQVEKSIIEAQPFPAPPPELQNALLNRGVSVGFPL